MTIPDLSWYEFSWIITFHVSFAFDKTLGHCIQDTAVIGRLHMALPNAIRSSVAKLRVRIRINNQLSDMIRITPNLRVIPTAKNCLQFSSKFSRMILMRNC